MSEQWREAFRWAFVRAIMQAALMALVVALVVWALIAGAVAVASNLSPAQRPPALFVAADPEDRTCDVTAMLDALEAAREFLPGAEAAPLVWSGSASDGILIFSPSWETEQKRLRDRAAALHLDAKKLEEDAARLDRRDAAAAKVRAAIEACEPVLRPGRKR